LFPFGLFNAQAEREIASQFLSFINKSRSAFFAVGKVLAILIGLLWQLVGDFVDPFFLNQ